MRARASEVRECCILGHRLEVYQRREGQWRVAVDGEELVARFETPYAAWAVGAAESFRLGKTPMSPPADD